MYRSLAPLSAVLGERRRRPHVAVQAPTEDRFALIMASGRGGILGPAQHGALLTVVDARQNRTGEIPDTQVTGPPRQSRPGTAPSPAAADAGLVSCHQQSVTRPQSRAHPTGSRKRGDQRRHSQYGSVEEQHLITASARRNRNPAIASGMATARKTLKILGWLMSALTRNALTPRERLIGQLGPACPGVASPRMVSPRCFRVTYCTMATIRLHDRSR